MVKFRINRKPESDTVSATGKKRRKPGLLSRTLHGQLLSIDFFKRHWLPVFGIVLLILIYITNKYACKTRIEIVNSLNAQLEVVKTEFIHERSMYMSEIRESAMRHRLDSIGINLVRQTQPPYQLCYDEK